MVKKLKKRFMLVSILSVSIVIILVMTGINMINYHRTVSDADKLLDSLALPVPVHTGRINVDANGNMDGEVEVVLGSDYGDYEASNIPLVEMFGAGPADIRANFFLFFVVEKDPSDMSFSTYGNFSFMQDGMPRELAEKAIESSSSRGFIGNFRYCVNEMPDGHIRVSFLDMGESLRGTMNFIKVSTIVSVLSLLMIALIIWFVSDKAIRPIVESYEKQKRFITDASHEIKTPLAIINVDADVLAMENGGENEWIDDIKTQTSRMNELTNDLILLSKMEEDKPRLMPEDVDLQKIVNEHVSFFRSMAESCDITMTVNTDPVHVNGDPKMLDRLISILMDNSVKYCPDHKNIDIICRNSGKKVRFEITNDTEEDIDRESIKHLFDRFYRTDSSHNSETGGHGIGLSIARAITDAHRGSITAEKRKGNSITFIVTLPVS